MLFSLCWEVLCCCMNSGGSMVMHFSYNGRGGRGNVNILQKNFLGVEKEYIYNDMRYYLATGCC